MLVFCLEISALVICRRRAVPVRNKRTAFKLFAAEGRDFVKHHHFCFLCTESFVNSQPRYMGVYPFMDFSRSILLY